MVDTGTGTLYIIGSFKRMTTDPDFKVQVPRDAVTRRCEAWRGARGAGRGAVGEEKAAKPGLF